MSSDSPEQLHTSMQAGQMAERMLEHVGELVERQCRAVEKRVFKAIESNEGLDPQMAVQAWVEVHAAKGLAVKLRKQMRAGRAAGRKIADLNLA